MYLTWQRMPSFPVDTRGRFNVYKTLQDVTDVKRFIDVETKLCVYWVRIAHNMQWLSHLTKYCTRDTSYIFMKSLKLKSD